MLTLFGIVFALVYENIKLIIPIITFHMVWDNCATYSDKYSDVVWIIIVWVLMLVVSFIYRYIEMDSLWHLSGQSLMVKLLFRTRRHTCMSKGRIAYLNTGVKV
jgi:hypothetical protein